MKKCWFLILLLISIYSCRTSKPDSFSPGKKYGPAVLRSDFTLLYNILKANHPSLYWYATKDSVDGYFLSVLSSITDSLTEPEFRNKIAWTINKIHCGHTVVRTSKELSNYTQRRRTPLFPLSLKVWDDSAVVINNAFPYDSTITRGTIITSINGLNTKTIIDSIGEFIGTDGYSNNFKYQAISFNFPGFYRNTFGTDSQYVVKYLDSLGQAKEAILKNFIVRPDSASRRAQPVPGRVPRKELRKLMLLTDRNIRVDTITRTAVLSVNTFSEGKLVSFFNRSFRRIQRDSIQNIILDLRLNTGGNVLSCTRLSQYLVDKPFKVADTVAAFTRRFPYKQYIKPWFIYWLSMHVSGKKLEDGRIHFRYFEKHFFKPKKKNHFSGNIYVLTGGYTFSAATLVASNLKGQKNVTIVGEETGGGAYGNTAMHLPTVTLPATRVRVTLPLYRMVLNAKRPKNGRGVLPDVEVKPSSTFIRAGVDSKMEEAFRLIREKSKN